MISRPVRQGQMYLEHVLILIWPQGSILSCTQTANLDIDELNRIRSWLHIHQAIQEAHYHTIKVQAHLSSREKKPETHQAQAREQDQVAKRLGVNCPLPLIILLTSPTPYPTFVSAAIISSSVMIFFPSTLVKSAISHLT